MMIFAYFNANYSSDRKGPAVCELQTAGPFALHIRPKAPFEAHRLQNDAAKVKNKTYSPDKNVNY